jgi:hypothetical protein
MKCDIFVVRADVMQDHFSVKFGNVTASRRMAPNDRQKAESMLLLITICVITLFAVINGLGGEARCPNVPPIIKAAVNMGLNSNVIIDLIDGHRERHTGKPYRSEANNLGLKKATRLGIKWPQPCILASN